jgi:hypothetical protein
MSQTQSNPTTQPEQVKTDTFLVFDDVYSNDNLELIARIEVPRYTRPNKDGVRMGAERRKLLAVARAVEADDTSISNGSGGEIKDEAALVGHNFNVLTEIDGKMDRVPYIQNPSFDAVWNPEDN